MYTNCALKQGITGGLGFLYPSGAVVGSHMPTRTRKAKAKQVKFVPECDPGLVQTEGGGSDSVPEFILLPELM